MLYFRQPQDKTVPRVAVLSAVCLAVSLSISHAGPCPLTDAQLAARGALLPSAPQSIAAQMHHQPTVASVAAAERKLAAAVCGVARNRRLSCPGRTWNVAAPSPGTINAAPLSGDFPARRRV
jgi:hypothetical protein